MRWLLFAALAAASACQCGGPTTGGSAPTAQILAPADGAMLPAGQPVTLEGSATDAEDGALPDAALSWSSDQQGSLGTGARLQITLNAGMHRLSLDAVDSSGQSARAQISVTVGDTMMGENRPPQVVIDAPADGAYFDQGMAIPLSGHATDPEDGALTGPALSWTSDRAGLLGRGTAVSFTGAALGDHRIILTATDSKGLSSQATVTLHVVPVGTNRPPAVAITAPANGAQLTSGTAVQLTGTATDPEDGALTGASLSWTSDLDGALGTGASLTVSTLRNGVHVLTLTATDGDGATGSASVTVSVNPAGNQPPTATITAPANGFTVFAGTAVTFTGGATDPEDGALSGAALSWSSSRDGALGTGASLMVSTLTAGAHQVRLTATDSGGAAGVATVQLTVLPMNQPPTVSITSPTGGATFTAGTMVQLRGSATDPEDGALSGAALTWSSSRDGALGSGASIDTASLTAGAHTLTLSAIDSGGRSGSAAVSITVTPSTTPLPPVANLTGPQTADTGVTLTFSGAASTDPDGTIVSYQFDFGDGSMPQTGASATAQHAYSVAGLHTVTLTVRDDDNLTSSATLQVNVTQAVRVPAIAVDRPARLGSMCKLEAPGGELHVAFREEDHPSLFYGHYAAGAWTFELVDGMGHSTGGLVGQQFAMVIDASGAPHVAYQLEGKGLYYATRTGGAWVRERADSTTRLASSSSSTVRMSLALDPMNGNRPVVAYSEYGSGTGFFERTVLAVRSAGTWSQTLVNLSLSSTSTETLLGDALFDPMGRLYVPFGNRVAQVNGTTSSGWVTLPGTSGPWYSGVFRSSSTLTFIGAGGVVDLPVAATFSSSTPALSLLEDFNTSQHAVAVDAMGRLRAAVNHGSDLEVVSAGAPGYWSRLSLGPADSAGIDVAVDGAGETRVCFFRNGNLLVY